MLENLRFYSSFPRVFLPLLHPKRATIQKRYLRPVFPTISHWCPPSLPLQLEPGTSLLPSRTIAGDLSQGTCFCFFLSVLFCTYCQFNLLWLNSDYNTPLIINFICFWLLAQQRTMTEVRLKATQNFSTLLFQMSHAMAWSSWEACLWRTNACLELFNAFASLCPEPLHRALLTEK